MQALARSLQTIIYHGKNVRQGIREFLTTLQRVLVRRDGFVNPAAHVAQRSGMAANFCMTRQLARYGAR